MGKRIPRVNAIIKKELGQIILREMEFPSGVLVTLTRVESSVDLEQAKVYVSSMPEDKIKTVLEILNRQIYHLQQKLNKRLNMRPIPRIFFSEERATSRASRIEEILEELKNNGE